MKDKDGKEVSEEELQKKIEDGLMPDLAGKSVTIGKKTIVITEMPIFYVKKLNRLMKPFYSIITGVKGEINIQDLINVDKVEGFYDNLLDIGELITTRLDSSVTRDWLEQNTCEKDLLNLIKVQLEINGLLNFFKEIWQGVIAVMAQNLKTNM